MKTIGLARATSCGVTEIGFSVGARKLRVASGTACSELGDGSACEGKVAGRTWATGKETVGGVAFDDEVVVSSAHGLQSAGGSCWP